MHPPPILQIVGYKNAGKTTLLCGLVERLTAAGLLVGTVKHDAHAHALDREHTDSWRHRDSGALVTAFASAAETAILHRRPAPLDALITQVCAVASPSRLDLILVEGFKEAAYPKLVLLRGPEDAELPTRLAGVAAIALRAEADRLRSGPEAGGGESRPARPVFRADDHEGIARWVHGMLPAAKPAGESGARPDGEASR